MSSQFSSNAVLARGEAGAAGAQLAAVPQAALFTLLALLALVGNHLLLSEIGVIGFVWLVLFSIATFCLLPALALSLLIISLLFQNSLLALLANYVETPQTFQAIQGTSFIITALLGLLAYTILLRHKSLLPLLTQKIILSGLLFLSVVTVYTLLGLFSVSVTSALSYARLYFNGPLLFAAGLWLCWLTPPATLRALLSFCAGALVLWGFFELNAPYVLYTLFDVNEFQALKYALRPEASSFDSIKDVIESQTRSYLNLSGSLGLDLQMLRLKGPSMHAISYGYALAFFTLVMVMLRRPWLAACCAIFAILVGAKGPLIMMVVSLGLYLGYYLTQYNVRLLVAALVSFVVLYITVGLIYGFYTDDYHVIGFMGGLKGFVTNPVGHGIGVGGNLSDQSFASRDFLAFQQFGADYALESALGVMLYQMGVGTIAFFFFYRHVWRALWQHALQHVAVAPRLMLAPLALAVLAVNTIFQEEALSPAGWGLWLLFAGILFGWSKSQAVTTKPSN